MWIAPALLAIGGWATLAWIGAEQPLQAASRKATYGFVALASGLGALIAFRLHA